ncbi:hypothetical protein D3C73_1214920 [compost metagenome]
MAGKIMDFFAQVKQALIMRSVLRPVRGFQKLVEQHPEQIVDRQLTVGVTEEILGSEQLEQLMAISGIWKRHRLSERERGLCQIWLIGSEPDPVIDELPAAGAVEYLLMRRIKNSAVRRIFPDLPADPEFSRGMGKNKQPEVMPVRDIVHEVSGMCCVIPHIVNGSGHASLRS